MSFGKDAEIIPSSKTNNQTIVLKTHFVMTSIVMDSSKYSNGPAQTLP